MVNSVIGICDTNTVYMKKLAEYFMQKSSIPLQIMTFSDGSQLTQYLEKDTLDILVTGGGVLLDVPDPCGLDAGIEIQKKEGIRNYVKWRIELVDFMIDTEMINHCIFKASRYRSSAQLLQLVEQLISQGTSEDTRLAGTTKKTQGYDHIFYGEMIHTERAVVREKNDSKSVIGIYSPVNRCGKTSLAVLLTELLGQKYSSLMISMDHHSILFSGEEWNLAELIYRMSRENSLRSEPKLYQNFSEYEEFIRIWQNVSYIAAPQSVEDLTQISAIQLCELLELLKCKSSYHHIVIDICEGIEKLYLVLKQCDLIFMPVLDDCISKSKIDQFEQSICSMIGQEEWTLLSDKIHKVQLPETIEAESADHYYKELIWSDFGNYAGKLLDQYKLYLW